jgi:hypothetical protein
MSFLSGLKVFGTEIEKAFAWFGSPKGQAVIGAAEGIAVMAEPAAAPIVNLFNAWAAKAYSIEALAVAASKATGTGTEKAELAISTIEPQVLAYATQEGLSPRTAEQIQAANDAVIKFINAMTQPA